MIPFLPEMPSIPAPAPGPGPLASGGVLPQAPALSAMLTGGGRDFAGLLDAALPSLEGDEQATAPTPGVGTRAPAEGAVPLPAAPSVAAPPALLPVALPVAQTAPIAVTVSRLSGGTILPETGAQLPPAAAPQQLQQLQPDAALAPRLAEPPRALLPLPDRNAVAPESATLPFAAPTATLAAVPVAAVAVPPTTPTIADDRVIPAAANLTPSEEQREPAALPAPHPALVIGPEPAPVPVMADLDTGSDARPDSGPDSEQPVPPAPTMIVTLAAPPAPLPAPPAPLAAIPAAPALFAPIPQPQVARALLQPAAGLARAQNTPLPARVTLPPAPHDEGDESASAPAFAPATPSATPSASAPATAALLAESPAPAAAAPAPTPALAIAPAPAPPVLAERVEPRADSRVSGPQLESTIAQVGDLREALRSVRPELTVRHAEFGFVSLRLEQAGAEGWRAVLASRDPGFVPAIQAALADRAVTASAAAADAGTNGNFLGQNGTSDPRYGSSHSGGQGSSQPYLGQSGSRDGETAPDHRRSSTTAVLTARAEEGEADGSPASQTRGVFA